MSYGLTQAPAVASGAAASTTKSYTISPATGATVVLVVTYQNANSIGVTAVKNQSGTDLTYYTPGALHDNSSYAGLTVLVLPNVPAGITSIQVTVDTSTVLGLQPFEYSGLWTSASAAGTNSGTPTATLATDNLTQGVTPTQQPAMLWSVAMDITHNSGPNAGTGFTSRALSSPSLSFGTNTYRVEDLRITSTSAVNATFTNVSTSGDQFQVITVVIPEPPPPPTLTAGVPTSGSTLSTSSTATVGATTDKGDGTMYSVVTTSSLTGVTGPQVAAGQNAAGSTSGVANANVAITATGAATTPQYTGLSANTSYNYAVVHNAAGGYSNVIVGTFTTHTPVPTITGVTPSPLVDGSAGTIAGTTFGSTKGTGHADLATVAQTTTAWSDTSITETVAIGANAYGVNVNQTVTNNAGDTGSAYVVTINPPTGWNYVNVGTPNTTAANRLTASSDAASGDQCAWGNIVGTGSVTVNSDLTFVADSGVSSFDVKFWTPGSGWGSVQTQTVSTSTAYYLTLTAAITLAVICIRAARSIRAAASATTSVGLKTVSTAKSAASATSAAIKRAAQLARAATSATSATVLKTAGAIRGTSTSTAASIAKAAIATRSAGTTVLAALSQIKVKLMTLIAATATASAIVRTVASAKSASLTLIAVAAKRASLPKLGQLTTSGTMAKTVQAVRSAASATIAALQTIKAKLLQLIATTATSATTLKRMLTTKSASVATASSSVRNVLVQRVVTIATSATLTKFVTAAKSAITATAAIRTLSRSMTFVAATAIGSLVAKRISGIRSAILTTSSSLGRAIAIRRIAATQTSALLTKTISMTKSVTVSVLGALSFRRIYQITLAAATSIGASIFYPSSLVYSILRKFGFLVDSRSCRLPSDGPRSYTFPQE